ncbi:acyl carrier protein [Nitrogeniibacter mangrovi]|uniref:Acyl carrier protein n=1 Tax=Nitrogeniibacter mangrovi TaxID=2016596 RepID=A0A6C1B6L8_9RHOO|nr:acyl carrier protein [Nitrogeniibacter mangrovi]QID18435.1 acyl carrier protein [Nitrogeniibacter mangrovi]
MKTPAEIRSAILGLLARIAPEADLAELKGDVPIRRQIDLDSMDSLNVIAGLTERFGVDVPESDYGRLQTVDDMVDYVATRLAAARGGA